MDDLNKYKNFIIDFGGVLYDIDESLSWNAFIDLSSEPKKILLAKQAGFSNINIFTDYEKGEISSEEFRFLVRKEFSINCSDTDFDKAWNTTLISKYSDAEENIIKLKKIGRVILLSNTNEIHYNHFAPECANLFAEFEQCFFSFKLKMRKPGLDFFEYVIKKMGFKTEETLFIDDSAANIEAGRKSGLSVYLIGKNRLSDFLKV